MAPLSLSLFNNRLRFKASGEAEPLESVEFLSVIWNDVHGARASSTKYGTRSVPIIQWGSKILQRRVISSLYQSGLLRIWKLGMCKVWIIPSMSIYSTVHSVASVTLARLSIFLSNRYRSPFIFLSSTRSWFMLRPCFASCLW